MSTRPASVSASAAPQLPPRDSRALYDEKDKVTVAPSGSGTSTSQAEANDRTMDNTRHEDDMRQLTPYELSERTQQMLTSLTSSHPLVSPSLPISDLRAEYEHGSQRFVAQIDYLQRQGFRRIRRTRGDGDCFYRSISFAWLVRMLSLPSHHSKTLCVAKTLSLLSEGALVRLKAAGFQELVYEDLYDVLSSLVRQIVVPEPGGNILSLDVLEEAFGDVEVSNCIVVFLRLLTSAVIRTEPDTYAPFLFDPETGEDISPREFCERFVEACGKEADHVQITALTKLLKLNVEVAYLDGHVSDDSNADDAGAEALVNFVSFHNVPPEDFEKPLVLLYRPGHYDILEQEQE